jgi:hypothetical protein
MSSCKPLVYLENISNVIYTEGVVRIELTTRTQPNGDQESPTAVYSMSCLVMSLSALLRLSE